MSSASSEKRAEAVDTLTYDHIKGLVVGNSISDVEAFFANIQLKEGQTAPHLHGMAGRPRSLLACLVALYYEHQQPVGEMKRHSLDDVARFCSDLVAAMFARKNSPGVDTDTLWWALCEDINCFDKPSRLLKTLLASAGNLANHKVRRGMERELPIFFAVIEERLTAVEPNFAHDVLQRLLDAMKNVAEKGEPYPVSMNEVFRTEKDEALTPLLYTLRKTNARNAPAVQSIIQMLLNLGAQISLSAKTSSTNTACSLLLALVLEQNQAGLEQICQFFEVERNATPEQRLAFAALLGSAEPSLVGICKAQMYSEDAPTWLAMAARLLVHGAPFPADIIPFATRRLAFVQNIVSYIAAIDDQKIQAKLAIRTLLAMQNSHEWKDILCIEGNKQTGVLNLFNRDKTRHLEWSNRDALFFASTLLSCLNPTVFAPESPEEASWLFWSFVAEYITAHKNSTFANANMWRLLEDGHVRNWQDVLDYTRKNGKDTSRSAGIVAKLKDDLNALRKQAEEPLAVEVMPSDNSDSAQPKSTLAEEALPQREANADADMPTGIKPGSGDKGKQPLADAAEDVAPTVAQSAVSIFPVVLSESHTVEAADADVPANLKTDGNASESDNPSVAEPVDSSSNPAAPSTL